MEVVLCAYGCGQPGTHLVGKAARPCCSPHYTQCRAFQEARRRTVEARGGFPLSNPATRAKAQQRIQEIYGVDNVGRVPAIRDKIASTNLQRYGVANVFAADEVKQRVRDTHLAHRGVPNPSMDPKVQAKRAATFFERFGGNPQQDPEIRSKTSLTNQNRYGGKAPMCSPEVQSRARATVLLRYGPLAPWHLPGVRAKAVKTRLCRYGQVDPLLRPDVRKRAVRSAFRKKAFKLPSGREVWVQGYEAEVISILLMEFSEDDIALGADVPRIPYVFEGKPHTYIPDILLKPLNLLLEVKSLWTFQGGPDTCGTGVGNLRYEQNQAKAQAACQAGYSHQFLVKDDKHWCCLPLRKPL